MEFNAVNNAATKFIKLRNDIKNIASKKIVISSKLKKKILASYVTF